MRRLPPCRKDLTRRNVEFSAEKPNSRNTTRNKWRLHRPHGQERSVEKREMALPEVRQREVASKLFPFRPEILRRRFTEVRRISWKRNRALSVQCSFLTVTRRRNASRGS